MEIRFECEQCGQHLRMDERGGGMEIQCPGCQQTLTVPYLARAPRKPGAKSDSGQSPPGAPSPASDGQTLCSLGLGFFPLATRKEFHDRLGTWLQPRASPPEAGGQATLQARPENCREADQGMDLALELLTRGERAEAAKLLIPCVRTYRAGGAVCQYDLADALWRLGYALGALGASRSSLLALANAAMLLRRQRRCREWIRCGITLLAVRAEDGQWELPGLNLRQLTDGCQRLRAAEELLALVLLSAYRLAQTGAVDRVNQTLLRAEQLAEKIGPKAVELVHHVRPRCDPGAMFLSFAQSATRQPCSDVPQARAALEQLNPIGLPTRRLALAVRAADFGGIFPGAEGLMSVGLLLEPVLRLYARRGGAWLLIERALQREAQARAFLEQASRQARGAARCRAMIRLCHEIRRKSPQACPADAFARVLALQALYGLVAHRPRRASVYAGAIRPLGKDRQWVHAQLREANLPPEQRVLVPALLELIT
jgi:hypothetical protein